MKKNILILICTALAALGTTAQNFEWAKQMGGVSSEEARSITTDASGNVYTAGFFNGIADFDPGVGVFNLTSVGGDDIFISKLDAVGNFVWAKQMGGMGIDKSFSITIDVSGNVYATGFYNGTVDFDPGPGTFNLTSAGSYDIFISKLDASGNFLWAKQIGGTNIEEGRSITTDVFGNVYTMGYFTGTADFDPSPSIFNLTSVGGSDIFICKLDASGNFLWAKQMGGTNPDIGFSIITDTLGNVYTTGHFNGTADFDPGPSIFNLYSAGSYDIFISKLDAAGNFVWAVQMGGIGDDRGRSIVTDASGNIYITGWFEGTVDFDTGPGSFNLTSAGGSDIFISKLNTAGNFVWAKRIGGIDNDISYSINTDAFGNVYTTGHFEGTVDFDPGTGIFNLTSAGDEDIFISKLDAAGYFVWAKQMGGTVADYGFSLTTDVSGNVYTTGYFQNTVDFDTGPGTYNLTSAGSLDIFVHKLSQCMLDVTTTTSGVTITSNEAGATYQWLDCDNNYAIIPGETNQSFTATVNGNYAVEVTKSGCVDTSACVAINNVSVKEYGNSIQCVIYPNPTKGVLNIQSNDDIKTIVVYNTLGTLVQTENLKTFSISALPQGMYFINIQTEKGSITKRIIKH